MGILDNTLGRYQAGRAASKAGALVWRRVWTAARPFVDVATVVVLTFVFVMALTLPWVAAYFGITNVLHFLAGLFVVGAVTILIRTAVT